ncbi:MAG: cation:proton antiporter [Cyanobacteria bacterium J06634_6]
MFFTELPISLSPLSITLMWVVFPLLVGFSVYLFPRLARVLSLAVALASLPYGLWHTTLQSPLRIQLVDSFGVNLLMDELSGYFILTNALVTTAVILYCWQQNKGSFFYTQVTILHGCVNAIFICADLISLYVALEVIGIAAFLLITYPRTNKSIWVGLRYLFISNTAMLFYLMGAALAYQSGGSFAFTGLAGVPPEAIALIFLGLLSKGGIFVSGLWLPLTHSESETPVSAMLSGIVVKAGVFPLVRFALLVPELGPLVQIFGVGTAVLGVSLAIAQKDTKRVLACSTISQIGFILAAPAVAGFYAFAHGTAKAALFLTVGKLPSRDFATLRQTSIRFSLWILIAIASFSIAGLPLVAGFDAKVLSLKQLEGLPLIALNVVTVGSAIALSQFIFLPFYNDLRDNSPKLSSLQSAGVQSAGVQSAGVLTKASTQPAFSITARWAVALLIGGLVVASALHIEEYTPANLAKALGKGGLGFLLYQVCVRRLKFNFSQTPEKLEHIVGGMSLLLTLLFWMAVEYGA